jgi:hypothetical protein
MAKGKVDIIETSPTAKVNKVTWINSDFITFPNAVVKNTRALFDNANSPKKLKKDCDGVILFEHEGKKYIFLTEIKSTFGTQDLYKAKQQIVFTYIRMNMLMQLSQVYHIEDYIVKGFIVGNPPKGDFLSNINTSMALPNGDPKRLEYNLTRKLFLPSLGKPIHSIELKSTDLECIKDLPLGDRGIFDKIGLYFIDVPADTNSIQLDIANFV